jgi:hypothetical protein
MTRAQVFPAVLIVLDVAAAVVYALEPDVRRSVYWLAAAVLTAVVTF